LVVEELKPQLLNTGRKLSETVPFPWSRPTFSAKKSIFNLVPCDNEFEKEFAKFLEKSPDVGAILEIAAAIWIRDRVHRCGRKS
jgi:type III restriction enzyme